MRTLPLGQSEGEVQPFYFASDETQKSRLADPRLLGRPDDAGALVTSHSRGDLLCRSDEHFVAAGDGLPLGGTQGSSQMPIHDRTCLAPFGTSFSTPSRAADPNPKVVVSDVLSKPWAAQRLHRYGVVVDTRTRPARSRMGREYSVESLWMSVLPARSADLARAAVSAR